MGDNPLPVLGLMPTAVETTIRVIWVLLTRLVAIVGGAYVMYRVRSILISLLVSILLTYALLPFVDAFCRRFRFRNAKTGRLVGTVVVFVAFITLTVMVVGAIVAPFSREVSRFAGKPAASSKQKPMASGTACKLVGSAPVSGKAAKKPQLTGDWAAYSQRMKGLFASAGKWYTSTVPADARNFIAGLDYSTAANSVAGYLQGVLNSTSQWIGYLMEMVLIPVMAFYFVLDYRSLTREFYGLVPKKRRREALRLGRDAGQILQSYVVGQVILCLLAGLLTGVVLGVLHIPYVVVLALFAAVTRAVPVIGPVVSGIPIVLVGLLSSGSTMALWLLVFVVVMHFAESKFIMPKLIGDRLHLHPAVVIIVLLIGAEFFGLIGMFLAAPVAAIARELVRLYYVGPRERASKASDQDESPLASVGSV